MTAPTLRRSSSDTSAEISSRISKRISKWISVGVMTKWRREMHASPACRNRRELQPWQATNPIGPAESIERSRTWY